MTLELCCHSIGPGKDKNVEPYPDQYVLFPEQNEWESEAGGGLALHWWTSQVCDCFELLHVKYKSENPVSTSKHSFPDD